MLRRAARQLEPMVRATGRATLTPGGLDVVLLIRFYHDFFWQEVDRAAVNRAVLAALRPGGIYCVIDHHAESGSRERDAPPGLGEALGDLWAARAALKPANGATRRSSSQPQRDHLRRPPSAPLWR